MYTLSNLSDFKVKNAFKAPINLSIYSMGWIVVWALLTIASHFIFANGILTSVVAVLGLPVFIYAVHKDHIRQGYTTRDYTNKLALRFMCRNCNVVIQEPLKHENIDGVPKLYVCNDYKIIWFAGLHYK
jgi:hypothetical protein